MKKKGIIIGIILILIIVGGVVFYILNRDSSMEESSKVSNSDLVISNVDLSLKEDEQILVYSATLENNTAYDIEVDEITINFYLDEEESFSIIKYFDDTLTAGNTASLYAIVSASQYNISSVDDIKDITYQID